MTDDTASAVDPQAQRIIDKCGGVRAITEATGLTPAGIQRWVKPKPKGNGGIIPLPSRARLKAAARAGLLDLEPSDFAEQI